MFFLSSPPQPPPQPQFFNNPFAFAHSPNTPSPLRTSYNANGVKRSRMSDQQQQLQPQSSPLFKTSKVWRTDNDTENIFAQSTYQQTTTPATCSFESPISAVHRNTSTTSATAPTNPSSTATFTFTPTPSLPQHAPIFGFESRARASSPAQQLSSRALSTKAQNKARFLDRLRTRRDEGMGRDDRVLRADYLGERRAWEEEMARRAMGEEGVVAMGAEEEIDDAEMVIDDGRGEGDGVVEVGQSPTEDKEIEELVALLEREEDDQLRNGVGEEGDSQEWDEVFMEMLSQQEPQTLSQGVGQTDAGGEGDVYMS